jgi:hypothetical protein
MRCGVRGFGAILTVGASIDGVSINAASVDGISIDGAGAAADGGGVAVDDRGKGCGRGPGVDAQALRNVTEPSRIHRGVYRVIFY